MRRITLKEADFLRQHIAASGICPSAIAKDSNVPQPVMSKFMNRKSTIQLETANKIADTLGVDMQDAHYKHQQAAHTLAEIYDLDFEPSNQAEATAATYLWYFEEYTIREREFRKLAAEQRGRAEQLKSIRPMSSNVRKMIAKTEETAEQLEKFADGIRENLDTKVIPRLDRMKLIVEKARQKSKAEGRSRRKATSNN